MFVPDEVRDVCVDAGWIAIALDYLEHDDENVVLHALRSIGNICYNNGKSSHCYGKLK